jgi:tetratricopeptide (TPR) repeat protein
LSQNRLGAIPRQRLRSDRNAGVIVLLALAVVTEHQLGYWNDSMSLWSHTRQVTTDNYVAHDNLAMLLLDRGQMDEAMKNFHAALAINSSDPTSNLQIARYDHQQGRWPEAIARYDHLISLTPAGPVHSELQSNKGLVYLDMLDNAHAKQDLQAAVALDPRNYRGWLGLGVVAARAGELKLAIDNFNRSIAAQPTEMNYLLLAKALDQAGRTAEAQAARVRARLLSRTAGGSQALSEGLLAP